MSALLGPSPNAAAGTPNADAPDADASDAGAPADDAWVRGPGDPAGRRELGGKAAALAALADAGLPVPPWRVVTPAAHRASASAGAEPAAGGRVTAGPAVAAAVRAAVAALLAEAPNGTPDAPRWLAVRSSAADEDGDAHSFAGQLESYLYVAPDDVVARVEDVWASAAGDRLLAYRREHGLGGPPSVPAVLVQPMVDADVAGVAFSADPVSGRRAHAVVSAAYGLGTAIVGGEHDGDTYTVDRAGAVVAQTVARKLVSHRLAPGGGVQEVPVPAEAQARPCLTPDQAAAVAALARAAERHSGRPQDVEWAIAGGRLVLLQSRPVTSIAGLADPDGAPAVWDNSNITESYGGVTTPLTYTFARMVYEAVYAQFCRMVAVREAQIAAHRATFHCMIGLVRGRVYYNLTNWYRALALLPGYALNRGFMEQMMGVKEPLPPALAEALAEGVTPAGDVAAAGPPSLGARARAVWDVARCAAALLRAHRALPGDVPAFHRRLAAALAAPAVPLEAMRADELVAHYRDLERRLLLRWDAPLVNDFFAMLLFGALGALCRRWVGDRDGTLQNDLVSGGGDIVSAKPARLIEAIAGQTRGVPNLAAVLATGSLGEIRRALGGQPAIERALAAYLDEFGDRCLEELKLETLTLADAPLQLYRAVGRVASAPPRGSAAAPAVSPRAAAEARVAAAIGRRGVRARLFGWVLGGARARVRDRENLRFERTRLFGRVRRIFVELGRRYAAAGLLADPRDVFYLDLDEVLGAVDATVSCDDLAGLAAARRRAFAAYAAAPAPADRFLTHGLVLAGHSYTAPAPAPNDNGAGVPSLGSGDDAGRQGIGCYPGTVTGRVRVVRDPRAAELVPGEILVAERTDPGWVMLFPAAAALLVERGSLLSHSAIVARELGLPAVVSVPGLTGWLATGDTVTLDGRTGAVTRVARAGGASNDVPNEPPDVQPNVAA